MKSILILFVTFLTLLARLGERLFAWVKRHLVLSISGVTFSSIAAVVTVWWLSAPSPIAAVTQARNEISAARMQNAARYAPVYFHKAEYALSRAIKSWHHENTRWPVLRNYHLVDKWSELAKHFAAMAARQTAAVRDSLQILSASGIFAVKDRVGKYKTLLAQIPIADTLRQQFVRGEVMIMQSQYAFDRKDYLEALRKYQAASAAIDSTHTQVMAMLAEYLLQLPQWQSWANAAIARSAREHATTIIVDKLAATCFVYRSGRLSVQYAVELGPVWLGPKRQRGDGATPEGCYSVKSKRQGEQTRYYKALEINYPNQDDQERFKMAMERGELPADAHIGGLIEIHGEGGKGGNWTAGCVALRNDDMDALYKIAQVDTPVIIVGSLRDLQQLEQQD